MKRVLPGSILVAVLLAVILIWRPFSASEDWVWVEIPLRSSEKGFSILNTSHGPELRNRAVSDATVIAGDQILRHKIPGGRCSRFRLQIVDCPAHVAIGQARFVSQDGDVLWQAPPSAWQGEGGITLGTPAPDWRETVVQSGSPNVVLELGKGWDFQSGRSFSLAQFALWIAALALTCTAVGAQFENRLSSLWFRVLCAARNALRSAEKRPSSALALVAAIAVMLACFPVLFLGRSFLSPSTGGHGIYGKSPPIPGLNSAKTEEFKGSDVMVMQVGHRPYSMLAHEAVFEHREFPLWNRYNSCGATFIGQGLSMMGDPLNWLPILANGAAWAWDAKFLLARWLFAFGVGLSAWSASRRFAPAVGIAFAAAFIGFFAYRFNHPANFSVCYAPWILLCWQWIASAETLRATAQRALALALANTAVFHSGTAKESAMLIVFLNFTGGLMVLFHREKQQLIRLAGGGAGSLLFALLNAPFWMTFLDALGKSFTAYAKPPVFQIPAGQIIGLFDDLFYQRTKFGEWFTDPSANLLILAGVLMAVVRWREVWKSPLARALVFSSFVPFAFAFGIIPPELIRKIPFIANISHVGNTFSCILLVHAIVLAGMGWSARSVEHEWRYYSAILAGIVAVYWAWPIPDSAMPPDIAAAAGFGVASPFFAILSITMLVGVAALPMLLATMRKSEAFFPRFALVVVVGATLFRHAQWTETNFDYYVTNPQPRPDFSVKSPAVERLRPLLAEPSRVHGIYTAFIPGYPASLGIEHFSSADALTSGWLHELLDLSGIARQWEWRTLILPEQMASLQKWTDLLNNRYFLGARGDVPSGNLRHLFTEDLDAWESESAWPRAFFCDQLLGYTATPEFAKLVENQKGPFIAAQNTATVPASGAVVKAAGYVLSPNATQFEINAPSAGFATLTETWYDGDIRVTINGQPAEAFRANHAFRGVRIPAAGKYVVKFSYWPRVLTKALWLCGAGIALALVLSGLALARRR